VEVKIKTHFILVEDRPDRPEEVVQVDIRAEESLVDERSEIFPVNERGVDTVWNKDWRSGFIITGEKQCFVNVSTKLRVRSYDALKTLLSTYGRDDPRSIRAKYFFLLELFLTNKSRPY
jgi:hypothetical protein